MKCNNSGYGVWLERETGSFCHPSQEDWYSSGEDDYDKKFDDEILEGFHFADDYDPRIHQ